MLERCRILIVEDEYLLADELSSELKDKGAVVLGPVSSVAGALDLLEVQPSLDSAVLDVNLGGEPVFPLAQRLMERGIPLVFTTGYDVGAIPERYAQVPTCEKPINMGRLSATLRKLIRT